VHPEPGASWAWIMPDIFALGMWHVDPLSFRAVISRLCLTPRARRAHAPAGRSSRGPRKRCMCCPGDGRDVPPHGLAAAPDVIVSAVALNVRRGIGG